MTLKLEVIQVDPEQYAQIADFTKDNIAFHFVYAALHYYFDGRLEEVQLTLFQVVSGKEHLYCVLHEIFGETIKLLINTDSRNPDFVHNATHALMDKVHPILNRYGNFYTPYMRQDIREAVISHSRTSATHPYQPMDEPLFCYYINDHRCQELIDQDIKLPDHYYFVAPQDKSARQMCADQLKSFLVEEDTLALRLRNFPAVGVIHKFDQIPGNLVCYEHTDGLGTISMLYCQPAHRNKRLATLVEQKICQRNLREVGVRPFKGLTLNRPRVIQMTDKTGLWTPCTDKNGNNDVFFYSVFCREELPPVIFYEN
ncbi:hypothetical protein M3Y97_01062600 [Aphelenchoides bicaudatus]|nr:hypothetical protein M3Y97_01062600 [Aphelenchoides bicaudatus]